ISQKHQAPSSRETSRTKHQHASAPPFGTWFLELPWILDLAAWIFSSFSFSVHTAKNEEQFVCFAIKHASFFRQLRLGGHDHAEEEFRFLCFLDTAAYGVPKVLFRDAFIGFTIIRTNTRTTADDLINKPIIARAARDLL